MVKVSAKEGADKWARNTAASTPDVIRGVQRVTDSPGRKAAAAAPKWLARVTQSAGKYQARVAAMSLPDWQKATVDGAARIAQGVNAKKGKMEEFATKFYEHLDRGAAAIAAMPKVSIEDGIQKAAAQIRHNAAFKR